MRDAQCSVSVNCDFSNCSSMSNISSCQNLERRKFLVVLNLIHGPYHRPSESPPRQPNVPMAYPRSFAQPTFCFMVFLSSKLTHWTLTLAILSSSAPHPDFLCESLCVKAKWLTVASLSWMIPGFWSVIMSWTSAQWQLIDGDLNMWWKSFQKYPEVADEFVEWQVQLLHRKSSTIETESQHDLLRLHIISPQ